MPSLISRILGKKKTPDSSNLLDGEKYEAVTSSPSPPPSQSGQRSKSPSKRRKNTGNDPKVSAVPVLSLTLPDTKLVEKKSHGLGVVFEGITDAPLVLDDGALAVKRLTPAETLYLVQKASEVIFERGLETLGVMRPHWFASPRQQEIQQKLLSRFIQTLPSPQQSNGSGSSSSSPATFESELRYTRDPHDVAAVLRWGLRHLQLEGGSFGSSSSDWYRSFSDSERSGSYPSKAFDDILVPLLPQPHTQLLRAVLDLVSSLAAHSEENGISGNKLSKVLGWWIISSRKVQGPGWREFYNEWEASARQFEHVFLAYIRAQEAQSRMPKRLTELVKSYPFPKNRREDDGIFLPRSRFSTRSAEALFIKVTVDTENTTRSSIYPLYIVEDAFKANPGDEAMGEYGAFWRELRDIASIKKTPEHGKDASENAESTSSTPSFNLSAVLADESIRLLSLVPPPDNDPNALSILTPHSTRTRRSFSVGEKSSNTNGFHKEASTSSPPRSPTTSTRELQTDLPTTDWQAFTSTGFQSSLSPGPRSPSASGLSLAASLWDNDTEVSIPKKVSGPAKRLSSLRSPSPRRTSIESQPPMSPQRSPVQPITKASLKMTYSRPQLVRLDEAFIDFWSDTLLDSVTSTDTWPAFVVCQLKPRNTTDKKVEWLVIERIVEEAKKQVSVEKVEVKKSEGGKTRLGSTSGKKRWTLFGGGKKATGRVSEMGEVVREEEEEGNKKADKRKVTNGQEGKKPSTSTHSKGKEPKKDITSPPVPPSTVAALKGEVDTVAVPAPVPATVAEAVPTAATVEKPATPIVVQEPVHDVVEEAVAEDIPASAIEEPVAEHAPEPEPVVESATEPIVESALTSAPEIAVEATPPAVEEPVSEVVVNSVPQPAADVTPGVTAEATTEPLTEPTPEPQATPAFEPVAERIPTPPPKERAPTPAPESEVHAPVPEPKEPVAEVVAEATHEVVAEDVPEPVVDASPEAVVAATPEPLAEPAAEPQPASTLAPAVERIPTPPPKERAPTPAPEPEVHATEPEVALTPEPKAAPKPEEPAAEVTESVLEPVADAIPEAVVEATPEPFAESTPESQPTSTLEPIVQRMPTPSPEERTLTPAPESEVHVTEPEVTLTPEPEAAPEPEAISAPVEEAAAYAEETAPPTLVEKTPVSATADEPSAPISAEEDPAPLPAEDSPAPAVEETPATDDKPVATIPDIPQSEATDTDPKTIVSPTQAETSNAVKPAEEDPQDPYP